MTPQVIHVISKEGSLVLNPDTIMDIRGVSSSWKWDAVGREGQSESVGSGVKQPLLS